MTKEKQTETASEGKKPAESEQDAILRDVPSLHRRKCHDCGKTHWHVDCKLPWVLCPECKSQDTRLVKRSSMTASMAERSGG